MYEANKPVVVLTDNLRSSYPSFMVHVSCGSDMTSLATILSQVYASFEFIGIVVSSGLYHNDGTGV